MSKLLPLFSANLLPILITAGLGFLTSRTIALDPKTVSRITFYLFSPALVFVIISSSELETSAILQITLFSFAANLTTGLLAYLLAKLFGFRREMIIAVVLTAFLTNAGNFGMSLNQFAFGDQALALASIYFVSSSIMVYTIGVAVASMGQASIKEGLLNLLKFPTLYALILAIVFNRTGWQLPIPIARSVEQLAGAAIPAMLLLLGMQLGQARLKENRGPLALAIGMRLAVAPLIALGLSIPFHLEGPALQAGVTEASMPTAVMTTILATEFEVAPALVSTIVTATTILSPLTLTPLLAYLGAG
jgi:predicted permease